MAPPRLLCVVADDFGIGPETTRGILELATQGVVTGTVLLVTSPHATQAVRAWQQAGLDGQADLGWHPCLTLDRPISPPGKVPGLVGPDGAFLPLPRFLTRLLLGRIRDDEIERELRAQYYRFIDLVGRAPALVNAHHHVAVFPPVGRALRRVLASQSPRPFLRRVFEPWAWRWALKGARAKRWLLSWFGGREAHRQEAEGFPGAARLAGLADLGRPPAPAFFVSWLERAAVGDSGGGELTCHPGHLDPALVGREVASLEAPLLRRRPQELALLAQSSFRDACARTGLRLVPPSGWPAARPDVGVAPRAA
jgi:predicted glycoside hydrolase/deacetylase ChbG (UPF0249 family)